MRYMVRAVGWIPQRLRNVDVMKRSIPHLETVVDNDHDGYASFFRACKLLQNTGGILLEDDVTLCRNFMDRIEQVVLDKGSHYVISFFERPKVKLETKLVGGSQFFWMQCVYLPPGLSGKCIKYYEQFKNEYPERHKGMATDCLISYTLVKERMKYWRIRPCLVQHLPWESAIGSRSKNRQTLFFIDDLEASDGISTAE